MLCYKKKKIQIWYGVGGVVVVFNVSVYVYTKYADFYT